MWELWDGRSCNMLGSFLTQSEAEACLDRLRRINGEHAAFLEVTYISDEDVEDD